MTQTRITAGEFRSRVITTPSGDLTRPTTSRVREALFNILSRDVVGATVVDLYAGAGTVGFEALSRGAAGVTFVERRRAAVVAIASTAAAFGCEARCTIVHAEVAHWVTTATDAIAAADLCFLDAPYQDPGVDRVLAKIGSRPAHLVVCEHHRARQLADRIGTMERIREARYGLTTLSMYRAISGKPESGDDPS